MLPKIFQRVSQVPTNPQAEPARHEFDVADLYRGPATVETPDQTALPLDEKLRQAYFWIVNHAIISPFYDVEYNRIPTRTQSALLTIMADNYAEIFDQTYQCPDAAWYLTANDDAGGRTYQVIEALRDRIDIVVKALHFNTRFLGDLLMRIESGVKPEEIVPSAIVFSEEELDQLYGSIMQVQVPALLLRRLEFFASQFEFCDHAASQLEYKTKDTAKLSSLDWNVIASLDTGKDKTKDIGAQTQNGLSVRSLMTILTFVKAMAYFRGSREVEMEDVRQMIPFVLHDKLKQDPDCPYFESADNSSLRMDKVSWIRRLFDSSCAEYKRLNLDKDDPVASLTAQFEAGLDGVSQAEVRKRLVAIEKFLTQWSKSRKFYGHMFDDVLKLKYLHQRYTNYLRWLEWKK